MTLAALGAVTNERTSTVSTVSLSVTDDVAAGTVIVVPFGGDNNSVNLSSVSDTQGNTWDSVYRTSGQGNSGTAWVTVTNPLDSSDTIRLIFNSSNDCTARGYAFTGITGAELVDGTKDYTESATFSLTLNAPSSGVMFATFQFPFDYFTASISGWTRYADIQDGTDQQLLAYYKEVSSGNNTCSRTIGATVGYLASGVVLPFGSSTTTTPAPGTTTTPAPGVSAAGSRVLGFF